MSRARAEDIYKNVVQAMQDADEIEGVEGFDYLWLMRRIRTEAQRRANVCADNIEWTAEQFEPADDKRFDDADGVVYENE
jgi:hypothetical protein